MNQYPTLNLPQFNLKIKEEGGKNFIFDPIRKNYFLLTPEEWVRQHFINFLISHYQYPKSLIRIETGLRYNALLKRSDIIIYNRKGKPFLLIECKSAEQKLNQNGLEQVSVYNKTIQAKYIVLTNGLNTFCCEIDLQTKKYIFLKDLPLFPED